MIMSSVRSKQSLINMTPILVKQLTLILCHFNVNV